MRKRIEQRDLKTMQKNRIFETNSNIQSQNMDSYEEKAKQNTAFFRSIELKKNRLEPNYK